MAQNYRFCPIGSWHLDQNLKPISSTQCHFPTYTICTLLLSQISLKYFLITLNNSQSNLKNGIFYLVSIVFVIISKGNNPCMFHTWVSRNLSQEIIFIWLLKWFIYWNNRILIEITQTLDYLKLNWSKCYKQDLRHDIK